MFGFDEGFKLEVPLARVHLVGEEPSPIVPVARATWASSGHLAGVHRNIQWSRMTSLKARFDKAPRIFICHKDRGPRSRLVNQYHPPELANAGQLREGIQALSGVRRCDEPEYLEEDFDRNVVDGPVCLER